MGVPEAALSRRPTLNPTLTIGVLTKNESARIGNCLRSAAFADQLLVIDSGSTDDTVAIAQSLGAEVHLHPDWQGFATQRNRVLAHATGDYIFFLDADEEIPPPLQAEIQAAVASGEVASWKIVWRLVVYGRELRHFRPEWRVARLFRRSALEGYVGAVHEQPVLRGNVPSHRLQQRLRHYSHETVRDSLEKLTQYSMLGAKKRAGQRGGVLRGIASGLALFVRLYIFRLGFTGGGPGFLYCLCIALEGFFRYAALHYDRDSLSDQVGR